MPDPVDPLVGLAAPRPLSDALRARLQDALLAEVTRPVTAEVADDLAAALLLADLAAPRPVPPRVRAAVAPRPSRVRRWAAVSVAAAAAVAAAVVAVVVTLPGSSPAPRPAAAPAPAGSPRGALLFRDDPVDAHLQLAYRAAAPDSLVPASTVPKGAGWTGATWGRALATAGTRGHLITASPSTGPVDGGTWVILTGYGFSQRPLVSFGGVPAAQAVAISPTEVLAQAPRHLSGTVAVTVDGSNAVTFLYL